MRKLIILSAAIMIAISVQAGTGAAQELKALSGAQIRSKLTGTQLTDEVHWRDVYERDGSFRSYSMGRKRFGKWFVRDNELCIEQISQTGTHQLQRKNRGS